MSKKNENYMNLIRIPVTLSGRIMAKHQMKNVFSKNKINKRIEKNKGTKET